MAKHLNLSLGFTADVSGAKRALQELDNTLNSLIKSATQNTGSFGLTEDIHKATLAASELKVKLNQATTSTGTLDLSKFNKSLKDSGKTLSDYANELSALGPAGAQAFTQLTRSITTAEIPLKRSNKLLTEFATTLKNTARWQISSSILHGLAGGIQSAYRYAQDLNESLNNIRIVTGQSVDDMSRFAKEANKAAKALSTTTTEYTNAALIYYQQGDSDKVVKEKTDITVQMANVTRESAEIVSDQMTAIWNNFSNGADDLEHFADVLVRLGADTASSSDEIAQGMEKFASIGSSIGLSYESAAAALATVTATTRQSADVVGTAFKTMFARIQGLNLGETLDDGTTLNKYSEALYKVGINIKDQFGELKDMDSLLAEMGDKWGTLSRDQQVALAQTVAGVRQYTQLVALMDNWDFYEKNLSSAQNAEGALAEQSRIYEESWEAAADRVETSLQRVYASILDDEAFIDVLDTISNIVDLIGTLTESMGGMRGVLLLVSNIMMKTFSRDIVDTIGDMFYSIEIGTQKGREKIERLREEAIQAQKDMVLDGSIGGGAAADVASAQAGLQEQLLQKTYALQDVKKNLTEEEKQHVQQLLDANAALGEQYVQTVQLAEQEAARADREAQRLGKMTPEGLLQSNETAEAYAKETKALVAKRVVYDDLGKMIDKVRKAEGDAAKSKAFDAFKKRLQSVVHSAENLQDVIGQEFIKDLKKIESAADISVVEAQFTDLHTTLENDSTALAGLYNELTAVASLTANSDVYDATFERMVQNIDAAGVAYGEMVLQGATFNEQTDRTSETINGLSGGVTKLEDAMSASLQATTSLAFGLSQAVEASKQLFDPEVDGLQKLLSIIMLINGAIDVYNSAAEAQRVIEELLIAAKERRVVTSGAVVAAQETEKVVTEGVTGGLVKQTAAVNASKLAWMSHPLLAVVSIALMAVVGIVSGVTQAIENNTQAAVDNANATYDNVKAKQEECSTNEELIKSYDALLIKYEETGEGKQDLIDSGLELIDIYNIEGGAVMLLAGQYDKLKKAIREARVEELKNQQKEINKGKADTVKAMQKKLKEGDGDVVGNTYYGTFDNGATNADEFMIQALKNNRAKYGDFLSRSGGEVQFQVNDYTDPQQLLEYIEVLKEFKGDMKDIAREEGADIGASEGYKDVIAELESVQELYDQLKEYTDTEGQYNLELAALTTEVNGKSIDDINNIKDYLELEKQVASSIKDETKSQEEKLAIAREYLSTYEHLANLATESQGFSDVTNDKNKEEIEKIKQYYETLSDEEQQMFWSIGIDEDSTVAEVKSAMADAQDYLDANSLYATIELNDQLKKAWESQDYDKLKELIDTGDFGISWEDFLKMSPDEVEEFIEGSIPDFEEIIKSQEKALTDHEVALTNAETDLKNAEAELEAATNKVLELRADLETEKNTANYQLWNSLNTITDDGIYSTRSGMESILSIDPNNELFANNAAFQELYKAMSSYSDYGMLDPNSVNMDVLMPLFEGLETGDYEGRSVEEKLWLFAHENDAILEELFTRLVGEATSRVGQLEQDLDVAEGVQSTAQTNRDQAQGDVDRISTEDTTLLQNKQETQVAAKKAFEEKIKQYNLDEKAMKALVKTYEQYGKQLGIVTEDVKDNTIAAYQEAIAVGRLNKGVDDLKSQYKDMAWVLENNTAGTMDYETTLSELYAIIGNIANIDGSSLSQNFYANNIDLIRQAAEGSIEAIDKLRAVANLDSLRTEWTLDDKMTPELEAAMNAADAYIKSNEFEVGVTIDKGPFFEACQQIVEKSRMSAEQAAAFFGSMGFDAVVSTKKVWVSDPNGSEFKNAQKLKGKNDVSAVDANDERGYYITIPAVKYISKNNSTGGNISTSDKGTEEQPYDAQDMKDKARDMKKQAGLEEEEKALKDVREELEEYDKLIDSSYGKDKVNAIQKKIDALERERKALQDLANAYKANAQIDKKALEERIAEYNTFVASILSNVPEITLEYDENGFLVFENILTQLATNLESYAAIAQNTTDETIKNNAEKLQSLIDIITGLMESYNANMDSFIQGMKDAEDNLREQQRERFTDWEYRLELNIEVNDKALDYLDLVLKKYEDKFYETAEVMSKLMEHKPTLLDDSDYGMLNKLIDKYKELNNLKADGKISDEAYLAGLESIEGQAYSSVEALYDLNKQMLGYYGDAIEEGTQNLRDHIGEFDNLIATLDHYSNVVALVSGEEDYESMNTILQGRIDVLNDKVDATKALIGSYDDQISEVTKNIREATSKDDRKYWEEKLKQLNQLKAEEQQNLYSYLEEIGANANQILENSIRQAFKEAESAMTGGTSFDAIISDMEKINSLQDEYLTTTNKMYETNMLLGKAQQAIDKTSNQASKEKYQNYIEYIEKLQVSGNLSKQELKIAQARLSVLEAESALEDAKNAKSTVRLQRDSAGNYGYVYTADQEAVRKAQDDFLKAQNELYNIGLEGTNEYRDKIIQLQRETLSELEQLEIDYRVNHLMSEEEYNRRKLAIEETSSARLKAYQEQFLLSQHAMATNSYNQLMAEDSNFRQGQLSNNATHHSLMEANDAEYYGGIKTEAQSTQEQLQTDMQNFGVNVLEQNAFNHSQWADEDKKYFQTSEEIAKEGRTWLQEVFDDIKTDLAGALGQEGAGGTLTTFETALGTALGNCTTATDTWKQNLQPLVDEVGLSFDGAAGKIDLLPEKIEDVTEKSDDLYDSFEDLLDETSDLWTEVEDATVAWQDHWEELDLVIDAYKDLIAQIDILRAKEAGVPVPPVYEDEELNDPNDNPLVPDNPNMPDDDNGDSVPEPEVPNTPEPEPEVPDTPEPEPELDPTKDGILNVGDTVTFASGEYYYDSYGTSPVGHKDRGKSVKVTSILNKPKPGQDYPIHIGSVNGGDYGWLKKEQLTGFDTGGYTGTWGPEGRLAVLHEKELILNSQDTQNILDVIYAVRGLMSNLQNFDNWMPHIVTPQMPDFSTQPIEKIVQIEANFPSVQNRYEIEEAFNNLINTASQFANRKKI